MAIQFSTARRAPARAEVVAHGLTVEAVTGDQLLPPGLDSDPRSEERRVGKECRSRWPPYH